MGRLTTNRSRFSPTESILTSATKCDIIYMKSEVNIMTLREFLEMNKNDDLLDVFVYDNEGVYILSARKRFFLDEEVFINKLVLSFEFDCNGLSVKLDF